MTYYTLLIYVSLVIFDLLILNLVWRALKGPNQLTELSAAVVSFVFIVIAVVVTFTALTTTVEAAKLTKAIPGDSVISHTTRSDRYSGYKYRRGYKSCRTLKACSSKKRAAKKTTRRWR